MPSASARPSAASASPATPTTNSLKVGAAKRQREPRRRAHPRLGVLRLGEVALGQAPQPDAAQQREVDGRHQQTQALVGADVGGRALAADVLLARREREHEAAPSLAVHGLSDQAAGQVADEGHARRHEAEVRAAEADRDAEALGLAAHDVGAQLSGRAQQRERERLGHHHHQLRAVRACRRAPPRPRPRARPRSSAAGAPRRRSRASTSPASGAVRPSAARGAVDDLRLEAVQVGPDHLAIMRVDGVRQHHLAAARDAHRHQRRFRRRRGAVVHRGVRDLEAGEPADHRLPLEDRLQRALADLRLVRRVGGVELRPRRDRIHRRRDEVGVAARAQEPVVAGVVRVARRERARVRRAAPARWPRRAPRAAAAAGASAERSRRARPGSATPIASSICSMSASV